MVLAWSYDHADAIVFTALIFAQEGKLAASKKFEWGSSMRSIPGMAPW